MADDDALKKVSIPHHAGQLTKPFTMIDLAQIDDMVLSVYLCQGTMPHHRHLDQDELFLVHTGTISLDSEWGGAILRPGELAVAPKGVGHRSSSLLKSAVLLLQPRLMVNRRNGHRRLFALKSDNRLEKVSVPAVGRQIASPYVPVILAHVDTYALTLMRCRGESPWLGTEERGSLVLCFDGSLALDTETEAVPLMIGELVVVPRGVAYQLSSGDGALVMGLERRVRSG
jgi:mannose-6-phosphate isomerase-like protein (cupin superfamily)